MPLNIDTFLTQFSKQILDNRVSLFLGAGGSSDAGYPTWKNLFAPCAKTLGLDIDKCEDYYLLAQYYSNRIGKSELKKIIDNEINKNNYESILLQELVNIGFVNIWTTNFDNAIEKNYEIQNISYNKIFEDTQLPNIDLYKKINIFKMNGDIKSIDKIIATKDDYEMYKDTHKVMTTFFRRELVSSTFLFIGYSFKDNLVLESLYEIKKYLGDSTNIHYTIMKKENDNPYFNYFIEDLEKRYSIRVLLVDEYEKITDILEKLNEKISKKKVFISGAFSTSDSTIENFSHDFSKKLVEQLYKNDYRIVNGIGRRFGTHLIGYANEYLVKNVYKNIDKYLIITPFVNNTNDASEFKRKSREKIIKRCGTAIFVFGDTDKNSVNSHSGVMEEFGIACDNNKIIIPISCQNMISEKIWKKVKDNITRYPYLEKNIDKLKSTENPKLLSEIIVDILNSIQE